MHILYVHVLCHFTYKFLHEWISVREPLLFQSQRWGRSAGWGPILGETRDVGRASRGTSLFLAPCKRHNAQGKGLFPPLILLVTCSFDVIIWSMSVRSLASSGTFWASQASSRALYWPVVWHNTCLYTASEICRQEPLRDAWVLILSCVERVSRSSPASSSSASAAAFPSDEDQSCLSGLGGESPWPD